MRAQKEVLTINIQALEQGHFASLARHYTHAVFVIFSMASMGSTYATEQNVTENWTGILQVYSYGHS